MMFMSYSLVAEGGGRVFDSRRVYFSVLYIYDAGRVGFDYYVSFIDFTTLETGLPLGLVFTILLVMGS